MPVGLTKQQHAFTAYVVFAAGKRGTIWSAFCRPGWGHCWLMLPAHYPEPGLLSDRYTIKIEPQAWGIDWAMWWEDPEEIARQWAVNGETVVRISVAVPPADNWFRPRGIITCVSVVKAMLGIHNWRLLTPWHLFLYLVREGGEIIQGVD